MSVKAKGLGKFTNESEDFCRSEISKKQIKTRHSKMNVFRLSGTRIICATCRSAPIKTKSAVSISSRGVTYRLLSTDTTGEEFEPEVSAAEFIASEERLPDAYRPKQLYKQHLIQLSKQCNILLKHLTV